MFRTLLLSAVLAFTVRPQDSGPQRALTEQELKLVASLAEQNVTLDPLRGFCAIPVDVLVRDDLLEYLLVGPAGAAHESGFMTPVEASVLNVALLALGAAPGSNADWKPRDPQPSEAEIKAGASPYEVRLPAGTGFFLYVGWKQSGETYFYRAEDLIQNLGLGSAMRRHEWVFLGSRMVPNGRKGAEAAEVFAADVYQNLVNIAFFRDGYTLLTAAQPDCVDQGVWMLNSWLVPERGSRLQLFFSRQRLERVGDEIEKLLPLVEPAAPPQGR